MSILRFLDVIQGDYGFIPVGLALLIIAFAGDFLQKTRDQ